MAYTKQVKTCKTCGQSGLVWKNTERGWRLADPAGVLHTCTVGARVSAPAASMGAPAFKPMPPSTFGVKMNLESIMDRLDEIEAPAPDGPPSILAQLLAEV